MKAIILCAGYGTRLYPLTKNKPKALLTVDGKTLLDLLIDNLEEIEAITGIVIVSNTKFYDNFTQHVAKLKTSKKVTVLNDGSITPDDMLGAIGDLKFALDITRCKEEIMVLAGDNWFDFSLKDFYNFYLSHGKRNVVFGQTKTDVEVLKKGAVAKLGEHGRVLEMEEKPDSPQGDFAVGPFYIYNSRTVKTIKDYVKENEFNKTAIDAPGRFPAWLSKREPIYAYDISPKHFIDIGTPEAYYTINEKIEEIKADKFILK